jgi:predicted ABC-type ATPase
VKKLPILTVIAGCNGAGKSSYSKAITSKNSPSFDYDKVYLEQYNSLFDSEIRDLMAHNLSRGILEESIDASLFSKIDFTYETNFNVSPLFWPEKFRDSGFNLRLVFFCLNSIDEAKLRVQIRVENGGHFVPESEIIERYKLGFENLDFFWSFFDEIYLFDTSTYKQEPKLLFSIFNGKIDQFENFPDYLKKLIPSIWELTYQM